MANYFRITAYHPPAGNQLLVRACDKGQPKIGGNAVEVHGKHYEVLP